MTAPAAPRVRRTRLQLVRPAPAGDLTWIPDDAQQRVIDHDAGLLRVLGGPGTGKSATIARAAASRLSAGVPATAVLVLTFGRRSAARLREQVVQATDVALREVPVRSFESYAWAVLDRAARSRPEWTTPRLITGPEQDLIIRELLQGHLSGDGATTWPSSLREALGTKGFAREVRDALMRCVERGISADQLRAFAAAYDRPEWASLASFMTEYAEVSGLRLPDSYDPAELVRAVVDLWRAEPDSLLLEQRRTRHLYVDEGHDLDPAKVDMVRLLAGGMQSAVIAGDPDESVFGFRGADPYEFTHIADGTEPVVLATSYRAGPALTDAMRAWAAGLPGPADSRRYAAHRTADADVPVAALTSPTAAREAATIATALRSRHLVDEVGWDDMAIIVRSVTASLPALRRACATAGVPLRLAIDDVPLAANPAVRSLIAIVRLAVAAQVDAAEIEEVLRSPYIGLDALAIRRVRRSLRETELSIGGTRSSAALLLAAISGELEIGAGSELAPFTRLVDLVTELRGRAAAGASAEELLHLAWVRCGRETEWRQSAIAGGPGSREADQRLDGVIAMFDAAATFSARMRTAPIEQFVDYLEGQELPADRFSQTGDSGAAVRLLTANSAKGLQWDTAVIAGLQDGRWPNTVPRDTILGADALVDVHAGRDPRAVDRRTQMLQEERRLFYVACSRATERLIVTAVDGDDDRPSRFHSELAEQAGVQVFRVDAPPRTSLSMIDLLARCRATLLREDATAEDLEGAVEALSMLAAAGVSGAAPEEWFAIRRTSDDRPVLDPAELVPVTPSSAVTFTTCPMNWFLDKVAGGRRTQSQAVGTLVHEALAALGDTAGLSHAEIFTGLQRYVTDSWAQVEAPSGWEDRKLRTEVTGMLDNLAGWLAGRSATWLGSERPFEVTVGRARITGVVDRLERDDRGRIHTVDLKTGTNAPTGAEMSRYPQLGLYQLAVENDGFDGIDDAESAGAELVFVKGRKSAKGLSQTALREDTDPQWAHDLSATLADGMSGTSFPATTNTKLCRVCVFRPVCPATPANEDDDR